MTHSKERGKRIKTLAHELSMLLAQEAPRPVVRMISAREAPSQVRTWLLEQIRRGSKGENPALH